MEVLNYPKTAYNCLSLLTKEVGAGRERAVMPKRNSQAQAVGFPGMLSWGMWQNDGLYLVGWKAESHNNWGLKITLWPLSIEI